MTDPIAMPDEPVEVPAFLLKPEPTREERLAAEVADARDLIRVLNMKLQNIVEIGIKIDLDVRESLFLVNGYPISFLTVKFTEEREL